MNLEVYKITNKQNGKIYIGITNQGAQTRWLHHLYESRSGSDFPIHNAIRKYGVDNFQIAIIEVISEDKDYDYLKEREVYWIKQYDSYNREKGYNLTLGGDGTFGRFHSAETKEKIRQKALGRKRSSETIEKQRETLLRNNSFDHKEMSDRCKKGNLIRWSSKENKIKASVNNVNNKPVLQYTLDGEFIREFYNVSEAGRFIEKTHQNISKCASGKIKTAYGYIWKYKEDTGCDVKV